MTAALLLIILAFLLSIFIMLLLALSRLTKLLKNHSDTTFDDISRLLQNNENSLNQGFSESRKERREVSAENRRELQDVFKNLQDTLLNRIAENSTLQNQQLNAFSAAFGELSEKLINHSNDFRHSVSLSFQASSDRLNQKQDEFRDKAVQQLDIFAATIKNDAYTNRQELNTTLQAFEGKFSEGIKAFNEQLRLEFAELNRQQAETNRQAKHSLTDVQQTIDVATLNRTHNLKYPEKSVILL